jgi:hypothetical protein
MDFSSLVKGVQDFWDFIWPPVLCLVALVGIASYVGPATFNRLLAKCGALRPTTDRQIQFVKASKRFGFDKLMPVICAFCLIFLLDVVRNVVVMGGQIIPPSITYQPAVIILDNESIPAVRCLWETRERDVTHQKEAIQQSASDTKTPNAADNEEPKQYLMSPNVALC